MKPTTRAVRSFFLLIIFVTFVGIPAVYLAAGIVSGAPAIIQMLTAKGE